MDNQLLKAYFKDIKKYPILKEQDILIHIEKAKNGDVKSRNAIVCSYLKMVVRIATEMKTKVSLLDLIASGNQGVFEAINKFDLKRKNRAPFKHFARVCIHAAMCRYITERSRLIRFSFAGVQRLRELKQTEKKLEQEHQRSISFNDIIKDLSIDPIYAKKLLDLDNNFTSLEEIINLCEDSKINIEEQIDHKKFVLKVKEAIDKLSNIERTVLTQYYGVFGEARKKLAELGKDYKLTSERIRLIKNQALKKVQKQVRKLL